MHYNILLPFTSVSIVHNGRATINRQLLIVHQKSITFAITMTIQEAQERVDAWIKRYGVRYFSELTNMAVLTEEVGEVARVIARRYGDQSSKPGDDLDLADELADVMWVVMCLANQTGIDLDEALERNFAKKTQRDKDRHIHNTKLTNQ